MKTLAAAATALLAGLSLQVVAPPGASAAPLQASLETKTETFYPPVDGYRDVARFEVRANNPSHMTLQVRRVASGPLIRSVDLGLQPAGPHIVTWDARDNGGDIVDPGNYVVRVVAVGPNRTARSPYDIVRMSWQQLAEHTAVHERAANSYRAVTGECGVLVQLPENAVRFDMDEPEDCDEGFGGTLETHYRFQDYPNGFTNGKVIWPTILVHADGNHPTGFGTLGVEAWEGGEDQAWLFGYDPSSGDDGQVEIDVDLRRNQIHGRAVRYTFGGSTGDDYVLDGFVLTMRWFTLVPAPI